MKFRRYIATVFAALLGMTLWGPGARAADATIKIGYIDPFSGAFAAGGDTSLKQFQFIVDNVNAKGGALGKKFELVTFDDKLQPAEALIALKSVTDQNMPFVMSCVGSNVGSALIDAVTKHNTRNPDNRVLQLNCGQLATELTNEQCSFWHFRFAGSVEMRAVARIKSLPPTVKTVYLLNQDYLFGQSIQKDTKRFLAQYRPDIKIVGDEMIPLMQVKDFSPYITKIKASGAQSLLTGNYGPDLEPADQGRRRCRAEHTATTPISRHVIGGADRDRCRRRRPADIGDGNPRQHPGRGEQRPSRKSSSSSGARRTTSASSISTP